MGERGDEGGPNEEGEEEHGGVHLEFKVKVWEEIEGILVPFEVECSSMV